MADEIGTTATVQNDDGSFTITRADDLILVSPSLMNSADPRFTIADTARDEFTLIGTEEYRYRKRGPGPEPRTWLYERIRPAGAAKSEPTMGDLIAFLRKEIDEDASTASIIAPGGYRPVTWRAEPRNGGWAGGWVHIVGEYRCLGDPEDIWEDYPAALVSNGRAEHAHIVRHDPARVLREVEAKRKILDAIDDPAEDRWLLELMALPYVDRPGFREEWRP